MGYLHYNFKAEDDMMNLAYPGLILTANTMDNIQLVIQPNLIKSTMLASFNSKLAQLAPKQNNHTNRIHSPSFPF